MDIFYRCSCCQRTTAIDVSELAEFCSLGDISLLRQIQKTLPAVIGTDLLLSPTNERCGFQVTNVPATTVCLACGKKLLTARHLTETVALLQAHLATDHSSCPKGFVHEHEFIT